MSRFLWFCGWIAIVIWSLLAFATYGAVEFLGGSAMRNADMFSTDPETVETIFRTFAFLRGFSVSVVVVIWGIVSLAILTVPWLFDRVARASMARPPGGPAMGYSPTPQGSGAVVDLPPSDYRVTGPAPPAGSLPPSVPPRRF